MGEGGLLFVASSSKPDPHPGLGLGELRGCQCVPPNLSRGHVCGLT